MRKKLIVYIFAILAVAGFLTALAVKLALPFLEGQEEIVVAFIAIAYCFVSYAGGLKFISQKKLSPKETFWAVGGMLLIFIPSFGISMFFLFERAAK